MPKTWFVGARGAAPPPTEIGDRVIPLSASARSLIPGAGDPPLDIATVESEARVRVLRDLGDFVAAVHGRAPGTRWFRYGERDLSPAFRRPDEATTGFVNQATAFEIASVPSGGGPFEAWGVDSFQLSGLRAALGTAIAGTPMNVRASAGRPLPPGLFRRRDAEAGKCDILYLSLEPHVALQQDRVLSLLSERYRITAIALQRSSWSWPEGMQFKPREHLPLISYLRPTDLLKAAGGWISRPNLGPARTDHLRWMPLDDGASWLRSTWLRAAGVGDALVRAFEAHRPRLLIGTNLASGIGTVISSCAAHHGLAVLSLPTGADYLLPPHFDPADVGRTTFVVPGERIAERLRQAGVPAERLLAYGWPELDAILDVKPAELESFRTQLGFEERRPLAVFFSSPSSAHDELVVPVQAKQRAFSLLAEACRLEGFQLAVKLHPRESDGEIERLVGRLFPTARVFRDALPLLLHATDLVASVGSAVSFAGVALGKPTVILEANSIGATASLFASVGVGSQPRSLEELSSLLRRAASRSVKDEQDGLWGADGKVAERIRAAVDRLLN